MDHKLALALAGSLLLAAVSSADVPLPKNLKYVDPRVRFEGIDKLPDQVVFLRYLTFSGGPANVPYKVVQVKDDKPFNLNAQRRLSNMQLLALDRKEFDKRAKDDPSLKWLTDKTEGVQHAAVATPSTTAPANSKEVPVTTYRVVFKDGKLAVEVVEDKKRSEAPAGLAPVWVLGIVASVSLAWFGIWFTRRGRAPVSQP